MRAVFLRKEPEVTANEFCVEKIITLPAKEYAAFSQNLLHDYDFIRENHAEAMRLYDLTVEVATEYLQNLLRYNR